MKNEKLTVGILLSALVISCAALAWSGSERSSLQRKVNELEKKNEELEEEFEIALDDCSGSLELREAEISYWGRLHEKLKQRWPKEAEHIEKEVKLEMGFQ